MLKNVVCHGTETLILDSFFTKKEKRHLVGDKKILINALALKLMKRLAKRCKIARPKNKYQ
jgi:hypothetical protein